MARLPHIVCTHQLTGTGVRPTFDTPEWAAANIRAHVFCVEVFLRFSREKTWSETAESSANSVSLLELPDCFPELLYHFNPHQPPWRAPGSHIVTAALYLTISVDSELVESVMKFLFLFV